MRDDLESPMFAVSERARSRDCRCARDAYGRRGQSLRGRLRNGEVGALLRRECGVAVGS